MPSNKLSANRPRPRPQPRRPQPPAFSGSPSPSGSPPSHSDSPSGRPLGPGGRGIPRHWRKLSLSRRTEAASLELDLGPLESEISFPAKQQRVGRWLTQILAPHFQVEGLLPARGSARGSDFEGLVQLAVGRIISDRKLVQRIWQLRRRRA